MKNIVSIDVEDWFHLLEVKSVGDLQGWDNFESRVEKNFGLVLDILDEFSIKATCFFLGWIAKKHPCTVRQATKRGHEIASHGFAHQLVYNQTEEEFLDDIVASRKMLEDLSGQQVYGYRAPGFSITKNTPWAFKQLEKAGYEYDSSVFPAKRSHGYFVESDLVPYKLKVNDRDFYEFPISVIPILTKRICFFGGGYLRLFPYFIIKMMGSRVNQDRRPVIYYVHPRDIDPGQPRVKMSVARVFKSYVGLKTTEGKLRRIAHEGNLGSYHDFLIDNQDYFKQVSVEELRGRP